MPPKVPPGKLSVIVMSGTFERVHYALALASSQLAVGREATLFFTMGGIRGLLGADPNGRPGWSALDGSARDALLGARKLATFEELFSACVELGAKVMVCEMGLAAEGIERGALRTDVTIIDGGIVTFLNDASADGAMVVL
jgi:peroxiredoxin family protein